MEKFFYFCEGERRGGRGAGQWDGGGRRWAASRATGGGAAGKPKPAGWGQGFLAGASHRISLMKWGYIVKPIGAETTGILPCVS